MRGPQSQMPLFLARASYRQRRLRDVVRVLPIAGFFAWILPTVAGSIPATSSVGLFIFAVWIVLIIVSALINSRFNLDDDDPQSGDHKGTNE